MDAITIRIKTKDGQMNSPMASGPLISHVSDTARWVAAYRASETARRNPLFADPYASVFAGARGAAIAHRVKRIMHNGWPIVARTRAIDDLIASCIAEGCNRVINLAAGFDMRPYRLELPADLTWIEADLPPIAAEKNARLQGVPARCRLVREAIDLADLRTRSAFLSSSLVGAGNALVITEGLVHYLHGADVRGLASDLGHSSVRWWICDIHSPAIRNTIMRKMKDMRTNAPMHFAPENGIAFFEELGWVPEHVLPLVYAAQRYKCLPLHLRLLLALPHRPVDPRAVADARWAAVLRLQRQHPLVCNPEF
jgi:methyltransferase (TIGR00027 family)